ncbi:WXG100 family type VII secretion target [Actinoplanes sp. LDG1-06]|uniref:WXG100 family type VII secretion target n=1 Tax=Paractinoplanes ovalisporus TaxID=2810368 RepID=A0ABS2ATR6_9ACTN|nr:WXG100 family type VII secretion target [Actinoplanes ovalisporus]MBM2623214.1 WXG100 family type VII secretion target [Actinoplanes ovalisporus]
MAEGTTLIENGAVLLPDGHIVVRRQFQHPADLFPESPDSDVVGQRNAGESAFRAEDEHVNLSHGAFLIGRCGQSFRVAVDSRTMAGPRAKEKSSEFRIVLLTSQLRRQLWRAVSERILMSEYSVSPEAIRGVAAQVSAGASEIDSQRAVLLGQIQGLGDTWQGAASSALQSLYAQWDANVRSLHDTLAQIGQTMQAAAASYEGTESAVQRSLG